MALICANTTLPTADPDFCNPDVHFGGMTRLLYTLAGSQHNMTDVTDPAEWATRINNTLAYSGTGAAPIRELYVRGGFSGADPTEQVLSFNRRAYSKPDQTVNFIIDDLNSGKELLEETCEGNGLGLKIWVEADALIFGGNEGVDATVYAKLNIPESYDEVMTIAGTAKWKGCLTQWDASPLEQAG